MIMIGKDKTVEKAVQIRKRLLADLKQEDDRALRLLILNCQNCQWAVVFTYASRFGKIDAEELYREFHSPSAFHSSSEETIWRQILLGKPIPEEIRHEDYLISWVKIKRFKELLRKFSHKTKKVLGDPATSAIERLDALDSLERKVVEEEITVSSYKEIRELMMLSLLS